MERIWAVGYKSALWFELVTYSISLPLEVYLIACLRKSSLLHGNLKIMMINLCVTMIVFALSHIGMYIDSELQLLGVGVDNIACRFAQGFFRVTFDCATNMTGIWMMLFTAERAIATCVPQSYEKKKEMKRVTLTIASLWTVSLAIAAVSWFLFHVRVDSCIPTTSPPSSSFIYANHIAMILLAGIALFGVTFAACFLITLLCRNIKQRKRCDIGQLNLRYQYSENIFTIRFLMPITALYAVLLLFCIFCLIMYHLERHSPNENTVKLLFYEKSLFASISFFSIAYPFICFLMHRPIRDKVSSDLCFLAKVLRSDSKQKGTTTVVVRSVSGKQLCFKDETSMYFTHLNTFWNVNNKH
ncbi:hypothetical protein QR680_005978 [Steinernema hermaphroditum]|uniref:G-protein coupled receptors family 1 profile domain-containing protein n=1 Tax=Steinernema hermaphroditum TaxID=289476 RepID=A0AA39LWM2_9BILA|nr:hypothetical protein QR680_005978 [Steinernema hermaphroditum]